jgi:hypothetical protein
MLRIQYCPSDSRPELPQTGEDDSEVASLIAAKKAGNVLDKAKGWPQLGQDAMELKPEAASRAVKARTLTGHR